MIVTDIPATNMDQVKGMATMAVANVLVRQKPNEQDVRAAALGCCIPNYVFGDLSDTDDYRNDKTSYLYKRLLVGDTITFHLESKATGTWTEIAALNDDTLGLFWDFGDLSNGNLTGFQLWWYAVLNAHGVGNYRVRIDRTILGATDSLYSVVYTLASFDPVLADRTVRLEWYQDGKIYDGIDYTGCNWYTQIRVHGFFGDEQYAKEETQWKDAAYKKHQVRSDINYKYTLLIGWISQCYRDVFLYNFMQGYELFFTDYNIDNFDWSLKKIPLVIESIEETEYQHAERLVKYTFKLIDTTENRIKKNF